MVRPVPTFPATDFDRTPLLCVTGSEVEKRPPITVKFEIPYFTFVRYLKSVEKSDYQALYWVPYITQHGDDYRFVI